MTAAQSAIRKLFNDYLDGYNQLDAVGLAVLHASPCFIVQRDEVLVLNDENKVSYHEAVLGENEAAGEHVWEMADLVLERIGPNGAVAKLHWIARRPDGAVLWEDRPAYMLANDSDGWRILGNLSSNE